MSRVTIWTDKAGGRIGKGAHAEERYHLFGILSGCIVNSYASVTGIDVRSVAYRYMDRILWWSATVMKELLLRFVGTADGASFVKTASYNNHQKGEMRHGNFYRIGSSFGYTI